VKRPFALILLALLLVSCSTPPLWGAYATPTLVPSPTNPPLTPTKTPAPTATLPPTETPRPTSTPMPSPTPTALGTAVFTPDENLLRYESQSGDSLSVVAAHFGVKKEEIQSTVPLPDQGLLDPGTPLFIPNVLEEEGVRLSPSDKILPDSEFVFSATASGFDIAEYIQSAGGYLASYKEYLGSTGWTKGADEIERLALENSVNPRLLLALLEYESGWVSRTPTNFSETDYPLGYVDSRHRGLFRQFVVAIDDLSEGYYGWRAGTLTELVFPNGETRRIDPTLNAGTVALQYFFSLRLPPERWLEAISPQSGFPALYQSMFGDPQLRAQEVEPLFPPGLTQPDLLLPFEVDVPWSFTGGPHAAWEHRGAMAALDFAPASNESGCTVSEQWVLASAAGLVVRSERGIVILDLDGDGYEQTGWDILYLHIATDGRVEEGEWLEEGDRIGHPSCEGGIATGTHVHIARKYNGEWILADGPLPFTLSGWTAHNGNKPYDGMLTRGGKTIVADPYGSSKSVIIREDD